MGRKRKVPIIEEEKENEDESVVLPQSTICHGPMYTIMSNAQMNETFHKRYIKEMKQLYAKMDHDAFLFTFIKMLKTAMEPDETNECASTALQFCAKFVCSFDGEDTSPVLTEMFNWLLTTTSLNPHIRYRLCQFVNLILNELGPEGALDDTICDRIMEYMLERLRDMSPSVRQQGILAMQRLQMPDNPDDHVLRAYQFHLCSDPSPRVRQCVITCMGRNAQTIPYILDRLWDIDEKVRRHTYMNMSSYPVRSYKVSQRLMLLEQGLNDRSEPVRKVVITVMLKQWIESYQKNLITLIAALKLDSTEDDIQRFKKISQQMLNEIFKQWDTSELLSLLPFEEDGEFHKCIPYEGLTMELLIYWQCLTDYLQRQQAEEADLVVPELSRFCDYVEKFCSIQPPETDKFDQMEFQYKLLSLIEILYTFDLGDETGRNNLLKLLSLLLKNYRLNTNIIEVIMRCAENILTDQNTRLLYFLDIIRDICELNAKQNDFVHDRNLMNELNANCLDAALQLKLSSLKVKILELEELEEQYVNQKDYVKAQEITEEMNAANEEYKNLVMPLLEKHNTEKLPERSKLTKNDSTLMGLQLTYHLIVSPNVQTLHPSICKLYNDFICRQLASNQIEIRDWALKCGTAYSMLYETLAKDIFDVLYGQFYKSTNIRIWETSVNCVFELLDRYGVENFNSEELPSKSRKGRQLYNTLEFLDLEDESNSTSNATSGQTVGVIFMMSHFLDTCEDVRIVRSIVSGFCRLVLRGYVQNNEIIEKLLLRYFNPLTDTTTNQILGVFLENIISQKKQNILQPCLLPTLSSVLTATYDSPLHELRPDMITRFFIDFTRQEFVNTSKECIHNKIALNFLEEMLNNISSKELCKILAKEILTLKLELMQNEELKYKMKTIADKLIKSDLDTKTIKNIIDFKSMLDGVFNPSIRRSDENDSDQDTEVATIESSKTLVPNETEIESEIVSNLSASQAEQDKTITNEVQDDDQTTVQSSQLETTVVQPPDTNQRLELSQEANNVQNASTTDHNANTSTTFGQENQVGQRYLRRSLNMSQSISDAETCAEGPTLPKKRQQKVEAAKRTQTITRRNLRKYADSIASLDEPKIKPPQKIQTSARKSNASVAVAAAATVTDSVSHRTDHDSDEHNASDIIPASPAELAAAEIVSRFGLRSTRARANVQRQPSQRLLAQQLSSKVSTRRKQMQL